jgi:hypothetical protein
VLLKHRDGIEARHVCSDCNAGRTAVRKVRAVRRKTCCAIVGGGCRHLQSTVSRQLGSLLQSDVDVLDFRDSQRKFNRGPKLLTLGTILIAGRT